MVADGKVDDVISETRGGLNYRVVFGDDTVKINPDHLLERLKDVDGVSTATLHPNAGANQQAFSLSAEKDVRADLFRLAVNQGILLLELAPEQGDLEDVFHQLTDGQ